MKTTHTATIAALFIIPILFLSCIQGGGAIPRTSAGEEGFVAHCRVCHAKGGNVLNRAKALRHADLVKNGITTAADIVRKMRNPGPKMTKFDESVIPDKTAYAIADYVLETFK